MERGPIRLVSNLDCISVHTSSGLRVPVDCWTLVIESETNWGLKDDPRDKADREGKTRLTAYGTHWDWPVFRVVVPAPHDSYELVPASSNAIIFGDDDREGHPMATGFIMNFPDDSRFDLIARDHRRPIDFEDFPSSNDAWDAIHEKAEEYAVGTNMPSLLWRPIPRRLPVHS